MRNVIFFFLKDVFKIIASESILKRLCEDEIFKRQFFLRSLIPDGKVWTKHPGWCMMDGVWVGGVLTAKVEHPLFCFKKFVSARSSCRSQLWERSAKASWGRKGWRMDWEWKPAFEARGCAWTGLAGSSALQEWKQYQRWSHNQVRVCSYSSWRVNVIYVRHCL